MSKPYIKYTIDGIGDWVVLDVNCGEDFHFEGHNVPDHEWIRLIEMLGYKVECEYVEYSEHEWFDPADKMPEIGDRIIVCDFSGEEMEIVFTSMPTDISASNVMLWRYADEEKV